MTKIFKDEQEYLDQVNAEDRWPPDPEVRIFLGWVKFFLGLGIVFLLLKLFFK